MSAGFRFVIALLLAPSPAIAAADQPPSPADQKTEGQWNRAQELARKGVNELLRSFELFEEELPVYGAPYIDQRGNIIIPRKHRTSPPAGEPVPEPQPEHT